jgi:hypothetical protein
MLVRDAEDAGEIGLECPGRRFPDRGQWSCGAWQTTTERLAAVIADDPAPMRWAYPPAVELLTAEARYDGIPHRQPELSDYIDMSSLGLTDRGQIREMAVTITAPRSWTRTSERPRPARRLRTWHCHGSSDSWRRQQAVSDNSRARRYGPAPLAGLTGGSASKLNGFLDWTVPSRRLWLALLRGCGVSGVAAACCRTVTVLWGMLMLWEVPCVSGRRVGDGRAV